MVLNQKLLVFLMLYSSYFFGQGVDSINNDSSWVGAKITSTVVRVSSQYDWTTAEPVDNLQIQIFNKSGFDLDSLYLGSQSFGFCTKRFISVLFNFWNCDNAKRSTYWSGTSQTAGD